MTYDWNILSSVWIQNIYSHLEEFTYIPWRSLTLMMIFHALVNSLHQWLVIKWFLPCLMSKHIFTWLGSYQLGLEWRPWVIRLHHSGFLFSGCIWRKIRVLTQIHIVCLMAVFSIWGWKTWIYLVCHVAMFHLLHQLFMDLQCIFSSHDMVIIMDIQCIGP